MVHGVFSGRFPTVGGQFLPPKVAGPRGHFVRRHAGDLLIILGIIQVPKISYQRRSLFRVEYWQFLYIIYYIVGTYVFLCRHFPIIVIIRNAPYILYYNNNLCITTVFTFYCEDNIIIHFIPMPRISYYNIKAKKMYL